LGPISQINSNSTAIKDEICALLNGGGGVLLFDCSKVDNLVIPRSGVIIEKEKEEIEQKITGYVEGIYPKPKIGKNIVISWVPIVEDPFEVKSTSNNSSSRNFMEGIYIGRIVVKPSDGHVAYFWTQDDKPIFTIINSSLFPEGKKKIAGRNISKFIKRKFKKF
jgi:predicted HTH transcriptional regulator